MEMTDWAKVGWNVRFSPGFVFVPRFPSYFECPGWMDGWCGCFIPYTPYEEETAYEENERKTGKGTNSTR